MEKDSKSKSQNHEDLHRQTVELWLRESKQGKRMKKMTAMQMNFLLMYGSEKCI